MSELRGKTVVLAYSGGLDTSIMVAWLAERGARVVTATGDLGGGLDGEAVREKALRSGAAEAHVRDLRAELVEGFLWPALRAGALYQGAYPLATALGRPLLASYLVEIARACGADTVAHGCTGKGNDQVRFEVALGSLAPDLEILAPLRDWELTTREAEIAYARERGIPVSASSASPYSIDENLWGIAIECGVLEDPWNEPPRDVWLWTRDPSDAPPEGGVVEVAFEQGVPVALDGKRVPGVALIEELNTAAGLHGVGRVDLVEDRLVGIKSREVYEAPAALLLHAAREELDRLVLDRDTRRFLEGVGTEFARLAYDGLWYSPLREVLQAAAEKARSRLTGEVRLRMRQGSLSCAGRRSPHSLYDPSLATYGTGDRFRRDAADGFVRLWGLPSRTVAEVERRAQERPRTLQAGSGAGGTGS